IAAAVIFGFIASTIRPGTTSASGPPLSGSARHAAELTAGRGGSSQPISPGAASPRLENGGRTAPPHPRGLRPLGNMLGRNYLTWVYASTEGPRFTICRPDGDILAVDLTAEQVYAQFPDLDVENLTS